MTVSATTTQQTHNRETFRIVFWGEVARGYTRKQVARSFAKLFRIKSRRQLQQIFSGKVVTVKTGLTTPQAHRYIKAIQEVGGICRMEAENRNFFSDTELMQRKQVSFLEDEFDPAKLALAPKE